jgi:hypothetical protein
LNAFFVDKKYFSKLGIADNSPQKLFHPTLSWTAGRGPNHSSHPQWETFQIELDGKLVKPFNKDLEWKDLRIPKEFVALPR